MEQRVWEYMGGIARKHKISALQIGGTSDHVHALVMAPAYLSPSQMAQFLKGNSSKWIHAEFSNMRQFAWQDGFGAFTVSKSNVSQVIEYIKDQREHHRKKTFQEGYVQLLKLHGIEYDERYIWG
ncbi:MAG: transposase [Acidobacteriota bacterium]|nr:transposase [Acidobacteriota bacterium]